MKRTNWESIEKSAKLIKRNVKVMSQLGEFLKEFPEKGFMRDNNTKKMVSITEAKSSTLRRYQRLLDNFYFIAPSENEKAKILEKKIEIEGELNNRDDGIIEKKN